MQKRPRYATLKDRSALSATTTVDRRVRRTRHALRDALLGLLVEVGWDAIDVAALCARADIGRSTFYVHYTDKTDLLLGAIDDLRRQLLADAQLAPAGLRFAFLPGLLAHVHDQRKVFRALLGRRSGQLVQEQFLNLLQDLFEAAEDAPRRRAPSRCAMLAGSLFRLLVWWLGARRSSTPAQVEAMFLAFRVTD